MSLFFFQAEDGIRDYKVTGVQTCALPILLPRKRVQWRGVAPGIERAYAVANLLLARAPWVLERSDVRADRARVCPGGAPVEGALDAESAFSSRVVDPAHLDGGAR